MKLCITLSSLLIALFLGTALPMVAVAAPAGKIANATDAEVKQALIDSIKTTEEAITALKSGADEVTVGEQINNARQLIKRVEINRLDVIRTRSAESLKKARHALSKGDKVQAEEFLNNALKGFQEMQSLL
jgi:hypothetical protein